MKSESAWHYDGDLKQALVAAARTIVETDGAAALSLRAVARATGVSAMAPYHHFKDRAALVAAVAASGFNQLYSDKIAALANAPGDPAQRIVAGAIAYVRFVADHPELYRLMKGPELANRAAFPELAAAAAKPGASLHAMLAELGQAGRLHGISPGDAGQILWALVHGIGTLAIDNYLANPEPLAADGAAALLAGWGAL
ncbi:TetR/AcrR family transcriptional regulator [Sandarakinorhabdus sp. AAP62]|uniref:TetR/AcrR family transcriptional regulator n=1 Tax=Sandarakinorhabdus sp. AAP62 TaxID=1248916 RepID=UPI0003198CDD|nr:TetR/AcrR family transcriptional regulator [Sandarakinorhabdus sp. AAP62]